MRLTIYQLPFLFTLIAMPVPWLLPFSNIGALSWAPEFLALLAFIYLASAGKLNPAFKKTHILVVLIFSAHLMGQVLGGVGIGGSAIVSVIVMSLLFLCFFKMAPAAWLEKQLISQISIIYVIHVCFILVEALLLSTGKINILMAMSGGLYKPGTVGYGVRPQSLFNQSQAASQLCVFSATWFAMLYLSRKKLETGFSATYAAALIASLAMFFVYPNTTMLIVGIILVFVVVYLVPSFKSTSLRLLVPIAAFVFFAPIYEAASSKLNEDLYWGAAQNKALFSDPINVFLGLPLFEKLWGVGSMSAVEATGSMSGDLGIGILILQVGLVLGVIAIIALLAPISRALRIGYTKHSNDPRVFAWAWLGSVNAVIALGNLLSLGHYTVALQAGGRTLFSFHIAILLLSLQHLGRYRRSQKVVEAVR